MDKQLKTLEEHKAEADKDYAEWLKYVEEHCKNGMICPNCGAELRDTYPGLFFGDPPKFDVHCLTCGFIGYRYQVE